MLSGLSYVSNDVTLTEPMREYADAKLGKHFKRYDDMVNSVTVHLKVEHRGLHDRKHHGLEAHIAEVTALCRDRRVIRVRHSSDSMYASLDKLSDMFGRKLRKYKERKFARSSLGAGQLTAPIDDEEDEEFPVVAAVKPLDAVPVVSSELEGKGEDDEDMAEWAVVRTKTFSMPPVSVQDAVLCLEYIDHDFHVFRNKENNEVNVVYKRQSGGIGLIQPED